MDKNTHTHSLTEVTTMSTSPACNTGVHEQDNPHGSTTPCRGWTDNIKKTGHCPCDCHAERRRAIKQTPTHTAPHVGQTVRFTHSKRLATITEVTSTIISYQYNDERPEDQNNLGSNFLMKRRGFEKNTTPEVTQ